MIGALPKRAFDVSFGQAGSLGNPEIINSLVSRPVQSSLTIAQNSNRALRLTSDVLTNQT